MKNPTVLREFQSSSECGEKWRQGGRGGTADSETLLIYSECILETKLL